MRYSIVLLWKGEKWEVWPWLKVKMFIWGCITQRSYFSFEIVPSVFEEITSVTTYPANAHCDIEYVLCVCMCVCVCLHGKCMRVSHKALPEQTVPGPQFWGLPSGEAPWGLHAFKGFLCLHSQRQRGRRSDVTLTERSHNWGKQRWQTKLCRRVCLYVNVHLFLFFSRVHWHHSWFRPINIRLHHPWFR